MTIQNLILSHNAQSQILTSPNLRLEINPKRYLCCHIMVIRDKVAQDPVRCAMYPQEQLTNPQLNEIIQENQ